MVVLEQTGVQRRGSAETPGKTKEHRDADKALAGSPPPPDQHRGLVKRFKITKTEGIRDKRKVDGGGAKTQLEQKGQKETRPDRARGSKTLDSLSQKGPNFQLDINRRNKKPKRGDWTTTAREIRSFFPLQKKLNT